MTQGGGNAMVPNRIDSLDLKGFRSLADVRIDNVPNPMVLLGANGAGKSNMLRFLQMLAATYQGRLAQFVLRQGGAGDQLFGGEGGTRQINARASFRTALGFNELSFTLIPASEDRLAIANEELRFKPHDKRGGLHLGPYPSGIESTFYRACHSPASDWRARAAVDALGDCLLYQFHDTSDDAPIKRRWDAQDNHRLLEHGGNLTAVLLHLRKNDVARYNLIRRHISRVLPEFDDFEIGVTYGKSLLRWRAKTTKQTFGGHLTSDGSLRAFCLVTLLSLPSELLPSIILLDEPELGLHPFAVSLVSHMVKAMARERQVIVATQSPYFADAFSLDEIVVLTMRDGKTEAKRFAEGDFSHWLEQYTTGQLWWKNLLGGYP